MSTLANKLKEYIERRNLISVRRDTFDKNSVQGYLLAFSDDLVLLQYVADFRFDGLLILRRQDITELRHTDTDKFQDELLCSEGLHDQINFGFRLPLYSWRSCLSTFDKSKIVIVEDEQSYPKEFLIGPVSHVDDNSAYIHHFSGTARKFDKPEGINLRRITCAQIDTNYIRFYQRYFDRLSTP